MGKFVLFNSPTGVMMGEIISESNDSFHIAYGPSVKDVTTVIKSNVHEFTPHAFVVWRRSTIDLGAHRTQAYAYAEEIIRQLKARDLIRQDSPLSAQDMMAIMNNL